jgi:hypothetical protein
MLARPGPGRQTPLTGQCLEASSPAGPALGQLLNG